MAFGERTLRTLKNMPGLLRASLNPWLVRARDNPERLAFVMHRVTGVILVGYLLLHIVVTNTPARAGWEAWSRTMEAFGASIVNRIGEFIVLGSILFHGLNGIRLILAEFLGFTVGRPVIPKPPYKSQVLRSPQRLILHLVFAAWFILWIIGGYIMWGG